MIVRSDSGTERFEPGTDNSRRLRDAFGQFATGVTVITTQTPDGPIGMTANSFSSVSLDPALVLWCIDRKSDRFAAFSEAGRYAIHVLSEAQRRLSNGFAGDAGFFDQAVWHPGRDDIPALDGCLARFDCAAHSRIDAGDHIILVGKVIEVEIARGNPLIFTAAGYGRLDQSE